MDEPLKRRLVGATVLVALAVIFVPMLLEHRPENLEPAPAEPLPPEPPRRFDPRLLPDRPPPASPAGAAVSGEEKASAPASPAAATRPPPKPARPVAAERKPAGSAPPQQKKPEPAKKPAPSATPSAWVVQVASLSSRENAMKLVKKLRGAGLDTMDPRPVTVKGKRYYRVLVGPEASKKIAESHQALIRKIAGTPGRVVRYP